MKRCCLSLAACAALAALASAAGDRLVFDVKPGTKLLKTCRATHELRIDDMGVLFDDLPFVSNKTGGWVSTWQRSEFLDEYISSEPGRPLEFVRSVRDATAAGKAMVTRPEGVRQEDNSKSSSPLRQQRVRFLWVPEEGDWSRCYEKIDAEENWLGELYGEFELLALLPPGEVTAGDTWQVDLARVRQVFAPGGNLQLVPGGSNLFGRTMEVGIGGDFADFMGRDVAGSLKATYKGTREVPLDEQGSVHATCGVVELELTLSLSTDRAELYRMAMPAEERKEPARLEAVTLEYTLLGKGELLWNLAAGHFQSLTIEGQESYNAIVWKSRSDGHEQHRYGQQSRHSGPLKFEVLCEDGAGVDPLAPLDNPKLQPRLK